MATASSERHFLIDLLRGMSMAAVISLHALANYLGVHGIQTLWDWQQFAVQLFVFCSAYLYFKKPPEVTSHSFGKYVWKRFVRLYQPFAIFMVAYFALVLLLKPTDFSFDRFIRTALMTNGIDISWLVLLFLQFVLVFPFIQYLYTRHRKWGFPIAITVITLSTIALFLFKWPFHWKWIMWLPWSFMALYAMFYIHHETHVHILRRSYLFFGALFILYLCSQYIVRHTWALHINKYPPNLLILSYGIAWIGILESLERFGLFAAGWLRKFIHFLSVNSYPLFFVHYIVIYVINTAFGLQKILPWYGYLVVLFALSLSAQWGLNRVMKLLRNHA